MANRIHCKTTGENWDTENYQILMNRYGQNQCATNLAACIGDGNNMQELTQYSPFYKNTSQGREGKPM